MGPLTTSVEPLEGNKVRLRVAVPSAEFEKAIDAAFRKLAREVKVPGFRPGKAPRRLLEARFGVEAAREQALRDSLPDFYAQAVEDADIDVIAAPEIDITAGEEEGDVEFDAVVEVRPVVELSGYDSLTVEIPSPAVPDDAVDAQVDALRERFADLEETKAPLADGNYAEIDIKGYIHDEVIDASDRDRLPLRGRLRDARPRARRGARAASARATSSSSTPCSPSASASAPATRSRSRSS